jgi:plastocyanin
MKKIFFFSLWILCVQSTYATIHEIRVWHGYYKFVPNNNVTVQLGDTIQWLPLDPPMETHTITSTTIPAGAAAFDAIWQLPADTFFQYIPQVAGIYNYECTPHSQSMNMYGSFEVIATSGIDGRSLSASQVYPNPTLGNLLIRGERINAIEFYNVAGQKTYELPGLNQQALINIDVSYFRKGVYFARVYDGDKIYTNRIVIQ